MKVKELLSIPFEHNNSKFSIYTKEYKYVPECEWEKYLDCNIKSLSAGGLGSTYIAIFCDGSRDLMKGGDTV